MKHAIFSIGRLFLFTIIISCYLFSDINSEVTERNKDDAQLYETLKASLEVRKEYVNPALEEIWNTEVHCSAIIDDDASYQEIDKLLHSGEDPADFLPFYTPNMFHELYEYDSITPEMEKKIQEATIGHITYSYPNPTTIKSLTDELKKYPCSESSAGIGLHEINLLMGQPGYLTYIYVKGFEPIVSFKEEMIRLEEFIAAQYSGTWMEAKAESMAARNRYGMTSKEYIESAEKWLNYGEANKVYDKRCYKYWCRSQDPREHFIVMGYQGLESSYIERGEKLAEQGIKKNGKIPKEAIEMHQKQRALRARFKKEYPEYYSPLRAYSSSKLDKLIKEHAPDKYIPDPEIEVPKNKEIVEHQKK